MIFVVNLSLGRVLLLSLEAQLIYFCASVGPLSIWPISSFSQSKLETRLWNVRMQGRAAKYKGDKKERRAELQKRTCTGLEGTKNRAPEKNIYKP